MAGSSTSGRGRSAPGMTAAQQEAARKQQESLQKAAELKQMLNNLEKVDDEGRRSSLLDTLCSTDDILNLPLHPSPPGIKNGDLVVDLLKHQVRGLMSIHWPMSSLHYRSTLLEPGPAVVCRTRIPCSAKKGDRQAGAVLAAQNERY